MYIYIYTRQIPIFLASTPHPSFPPIPAPPSRPLGHLLCRRRQRQRLIATQEALVPRGLLVLLEVGGSQETWQWLRLCQWWF